MARTGGYASEIDPSQAVTALALLSGDILVIRGRPTSSAHWLFLHLCSQQSLREFCLLPALPACTCPIVKPGIDCHSGRFLKQAGFRGGMLCASFELEPHPTCQAIHRRERAHTQTCLGRTCP